jgi:hypothetical protein
MDIDTLSKNAAFFTKMWMDLGSRMMTAGLSFNPMSPPAENMRQMRGNLLGVLSDYTEEFMRSPQFLQFMKQVMDGTNKQRLQMNEFMTGVRHDTQGTAREDIDSVMVYVRQLGRRVLDRMDDIDARLDEISSRLDGVNGNGGSQAATADRMNHAGQRKNGKAARPQSKSSAGRRKSSRVRRDEHVDL